MNTINHSVVVDADPELTYRAIADSEMHSAFTGAPAKLPARAGDAFTTHGGAIEGRVLELVPGERIVQAWRPADWPEGLYSIVRFDFEGDGRRTEIRLTHSGLPEDGAAHIEQGWNERYWEPLAAYLSTMS